MKAIIDVAHGRDISGKCSPFLDRSYPLNAEVIGNRFREWKWSRIMADILEKKLDAAGIPHMRTNTSDVEIGLSNRVRIANAVRDNAILVSIHCNASESGNLWGTAHGWSVFVGTNASEGSKRLATAMANVATREGLFVRKPMPNQPYWKQSLAMCRDTKMPAVLVENLFQDNKEDVELLLSTAGKNELAEIMFQGIIHYERQR